MFSRSNKWLLKEHNRLIELYKPKGLKKRKKFKTHYDAIRHYATVKMAVAKHETRHLKPNQGDSKKWQK
jgi:hypothetical protein